VSEVSASLKLLHNSNKFFYKSLSVQCLWLRLLWHYRSYININMFVVTSRKLLTSDSAAIRFMFLDLTCFIVENVAHSHTFMCF